MFVLISVNKLFIASLFSNCSFSSHIAIWEKKNLDLDQNDLSSLIYLMIYEKYIDD